MMGTLVGRVSLGDRETLVTREPPDRCGGMMGEMMRGAQSTPRYKADTRNGKGD